MANVPSKGDLIKGFTADGSVRGDDKGFGDFAPGSAVEFGTTLGADLGGDATNRMGSADGTKSDPMFDCFKHEGDQPNKVNSNGDADVRVGSQKMAGATSDPMEEEMPYEQQGGPGAKPAQNASDRDD